MRFIAVCLLSVLLVFITLGLGFINGRLYERSKAHTATCR